MWFFMKSNSEHKDPTLTVIMSAKFVDEDFMCFFRTRTKYWLSQIKRCPWNVNTCHVMTESVGFYQQGTKTVFPPCDKYFYLNGELFDIWKCHYKEYFLWLRKSVVSLDYCSTSRTGLPLPIEQEFGRNQDSVWLLWKRELFFGSAGKPPTVPCVPAHRLVTVLRALLSLWEVTRDREIIT